MLATITPRMQARDQYLTPAPRTMERVAAKPRTRKPRPSLLIALLRALSALSA